MTDDEVRDFLREGAKTLSMASIGPNGRVHLVAMWYGLTGDLVGVQTKAKSQKVRNLRRDPRVTILVESGDTTADLKGVEIVGTAQIVEEPCDEWRELAASVLQRYVSPETPVEDLMSDRSFEASRYKRVAILIHPEEIVSWDHTKIPNGGYSTASSQ